MALFLLTKVIIYDNLKEDYFMNDDKGCGKMESPRESVVRQPKEVRKGKGMTQQELAELVGTKRSNISRLESGRYNPSLDFLIKVADGLGKQIQMKVK